jgi:hypothetical protein
MDGKVYGVTSPWEGLGQALHAGLRGGGAAVPALDAGGAVWRGLSARPTRGCWRRCRGSSPPWVWLKTVGRTLSGRSPRSRRKRPPERLRRLRRTPGRQTMRCMLLEDSSNSQCVEQSILGVEVVMNSDFGCYIILTKTVATRKGEDALVGSEGKDPVGL